METHGYKITKVILINTVASRRLGRIFGRHGNPCEFIFSKWKKLRKFYSFVFKSQRKLVERLTNRRTCKDCGAIYNLISKQPKIEGVCDNCSSTNLVQRADDKEDVIRNRLGVFQQTVDPVLDYYKQSNRLVVLDADQDETEIFNKISSIL